MSSPDLKISIPPGLLAAATGSSPVSSKSPESPKVGFKPSPVPVKSEKTLFGRVSDAIFNPKTAMGVIAISLIALGALGFAGFVTTATFPALPILLTVLGSIALMMYIGSLNTSSNASISREFSINCTTHPGLNNPSNHCFANSALKTLATSYSAEQIGHTLLKEAGETDAQFEQRQGLQALLVLFKAAYDANNFNEVNDYKLQILAHPKLAKFHRGARQHDSAEFLAELSRILELNTNPSTALGIKRGVVVDGTFVPVPGDPTENTSIVRLASNRPDGSCSIQELIDDYANLADDVDQSALGYRRYLEAEHSDLLQTVTLQLPKTNLSGRKRPLKITGLLDPVTLPILNGLEETRVRFEPKGIVMHLGSTVTSGHYFAFIKEGDHWFKHNDGKVTQATDEEVARAKEEAANNGYMVTYQKVVE